MTLSGHADWLQRARVPLAVLALALCIPALLADKPAPAAAAGAALPSIPTSVRVLLKTGPEPTSIGGKLQWLNGTKPVGSSGNATEVALLDTGQLRLRLGDRAHDAERWVAVPLEGYAVYDGKSYRGRFELYAKEGKLNLINVLPLEEYLYGVVPGEMPSGWAAEALRAQAVAARTYTARRLLDQRGNSWDVLPTVADQVYLGVSAEKPSTNQAVEDTAGEILVYQNAPIAALYCSDAGGCTAPGQFDYLQPVYSFAPESKHNRWERAATWDELAGFAKDNGIAIGKPQSVETENDTVTGHLLKLTLRGDKGSWSCGGKELRKLLGLTKMRSTRALLYAAGEAGKPPPVVQPDESGRAVKCFPASEGQAAQCNLITTIQAKDAKAGLVVVGSGNGHGIGMSQYGAAELANQGLNYREILLYFYRGVELVKLRGSGLQAAAESEDVEVLLEAPRHAAKPLGGKAN